MNTIGSMTISMGKQRTQLVRVIYEKGLPLKNQTGVNRKNAGKQYLPEALTLRAFIVCVLPTKRRYPAHEMQSGSEKMA